MICSVASITQQAQAIREATLKSIYARDLYSEQVAWQLTQSLKSAQESVYKALFKYKSLGSLPDNKLAALKGLDKLQSEVQSALKTLHQEHSLVFRKASKGAFKSGVYEGISEFATAKMPFYKDLTPDGIDKLTTSVFTLIDTDALDFLANYNLVLLGDVHQELSAGIKRTILSGIATGKGADDIVRDLGKVIEDKESFRHAGSKVFSKAQYRMEMIARTEVLRAHNQGRIKFHRQVGVQKLEWMALEDERMCPVCGALDGKVFDIDKFPSIPSHTNCRCQVLPAWPLVICGGELGASAAPGKSECILPPQAIHYQAQQKSAEEKKLKAAFESGQISDLSKLTVKQLQTLAKHNGVSIARTKSDFIKLLDLAEPGIDHGSLVGAALEAKLKQYSIAALRSKDELVSLLVQKQAALQQAKVLEEAAKVVTPKAGLSDLSMNQLQEMAKKQGVSLYLTKSDVIEMLDVLEPGVNHSELAGKTLAAAKAKYGILKVKSKEQLAKALEKAAGQQIAEQVKLQTLDAAKQAALVAAEQSLKNASANVVIPASPAQYASFLDAVKAAEAELAKDSGLPASVLQEHAKEIALKKQAFGQKIAAMKVGELKDIAKESKIKLWKWANKDELVTFITETDAAKVEAAKASIEARYTAWAKKYYSKPGKPTQPKVKTATPPSPEVQPDLQPVTSGTSDAFTKKGSEFDAVDAAWSEHGKPDKFKYGGKANVGGAHEKEFWIDGDGEKWLFKPVRHSSDNFITHGEEAAYKIGRLVDPNAVEVRSIRLNGRVGSIQKWREDSGGSRNFYGVDVTALSPEEIAQVQREHVIDWLIANHDGHAKQFLRMRDGKILGIDKAQAFKHLGEDKLDIDYHPNGRFGEQEPFYNTLLRAVKQSKVTVDPSVTLRYIREVEKISDDDYLALIRPYVDGRFGGDNLKAKAFYDLALARKHNLRSDFESFYADVLKKKGFRFESDVAIPGTGRIGKAEAQILDDAKSLGWQGKVLPVDENDIEDQNALIFTETVNGKQRTVVKMKIRPDAEKKLMSALRKADIKIGVPKVGEALAEDNFADDIMLAAKTVNHHFKDGNYNQSKLTAVEKHMAELSKLAESDDKDVREMAGSYIKWIQDIQQAASQHKQLPTFFEPYRKRYASPPPKANEKVDYTVRKMDGSVARRTLSKGEIDAGNAVNYSTAFGGRNMPTGEQYEIDFGDGVHAVYRPWSKENQSLYAQSGEFELTLPDRPTSGNIDKALEKIEKLGLKTGIATNEDTEVMYLQKAAYICKADIDPDYLKMTNDLDNRGASKAERIQAMRSYWGNRLGVADITKLPGYDPVGKYQLGFKDSSLAGGYRHQYRFDISDELLEKKMAGYALYHKITNNDSISSFMDIVMENNGALVSTVEKLRMGLKPGGMSPEADMRTGGATYVFTRMAKLPDAGGHGRPGLYFKKNLLRRMDAISYDHDAYGKVTEDYVTKHRYSDPAGWKKCARQSSCETIFKYSVTLLDNIECVVTSSESERQKVLAVLTKHGIRKLPDGRRIEEVVLCRTP